MLRALTSLGGTFALNVDVAPLPVLLQRAALLVAATAVVALEGLLYCERQKLQKITKQAHTCTHTHREKKQTNNNNNSNRGHRDDDFLARLCTKTDKDADRFAYDSHKLKANEFVCKIKKTGCLLVGCLQGVTGKPSQLKANAGALSIGAHRLCTCE